MSRHLPEFAKRLALNLISLSVFQRSFSSYHQVKEAHSKMRWALLVLKSEMLVRLAAYHLGLRKVAEEDFVNSVAARVVVDTCHASAESIGFVAAVSEAAVVGILEAGTVEIDASKAVVCKSVVSATQMDTVAESGAAAFPWEIAATDCSPHFVATKKDAEKAGKQTDAVDIADSFDCNLKANHFVAGVPASMTALKLFDRPVAFGSSGNSSDREIASVALAVVVHLNLLSVKSSH